MNILLFLGMLVVGLIAVVYTKQVVGLFGRMEWAERLLGPTGTYGAWKLIGVGLIVAGMLVLRYY